MNGYKYLKVQHVGSSRVEARGDSPEEAETWLVSLVTREVKRQIEEDRKKRQMCPLRLLAVDEICDLVQKAILTLEPSTLCVAVMVDDTADFTSEYTKRMFVQQMALQIKIMAGEEVPFHKMSTEEQKALAEQVREDVEFAVQTGVD